jgi:hypothetical protein
MRIVVTEYPKSGGTWLVSMLGDVLQLPKRDIYDVTDGHRAYVSKHPWYEGTPSPELTESCVIKSHERPHSPLINFPARFVHLVRDGRDVVVSKFFYERDFCVTNGIYEQFDVPFDEYVPRIALEWYDFIQAWMDACPDICRYEDLLQDPCGALHKVVCGIGAPATPSQITRAVETNTKEELRRALDKTFTHNTFVRKGMAGDWRNHFSQENVRAFRQNAGEALVWLGYEKDLNW